MYFALSLSHHVKVHSKQYTNYVSSIIFDGFVDLKKNQLNQPTILGTFLLLSCDPNRVPK